MSTAAIKNIALGMTKRHSPWWIQLQDPKQESPTWLDLEVPNVVGVTVFFADDCDLNDTFVVDIVDQRGFSLVDKEGYWQDQLESESFQERQVALLAQEQEGRELAAAGF